MRVVALSANFQKESAPEAACVANIVSENFSEAGQTTTVRIGAQAQPASPMALYHVITSARPAIMGNDLAISGRARGCDIFLQQWRVRGRSAQRCPDA